MTNASDVALIIEGGGMRAAYTAPCIVTLIDNGIDVGWIGGISAGASHTVNYLGRDSWRTRESFTNFASYPKFGGWGSFARGQGYFNAPYIYEQSGYHDMPYDLEAFRTHPAHFHIEATRADTGETVAWSREDIITQHDLNVRLRASSTLPLVMNVPYIEGYPYVDGALGYSGGILIEAAEKAGYEKFLVILSRPKDYVKEEVKRPQALRRLLRSWPAVAEAQIARPAKYNAAKKRVQELEAEGKAMVFYPDTMPINVGELNVAKLTQAYEAGMTQMKREWPRWQAFFGW